MQPTSLGTVLMSELAFYEELKAITQPVHDRLESKIPLLDPQLIFATYHDILRQFYGIYIAFDEAIDRVTCESLTFSCSLRHQTEWLKQDLCALGDDVDELSAIPRCTTVPSLSSRAELLGAFYVLNGATLGSQFIFASLRTSLGDPARGCTRFFQSYGDQVKPMWRTFLEVLVRTPDTPQEQRAIIASACDTFSCFERWFGQHFGPIRNSHADGKNRMFDR